MSAPKLSDAAKAERREKVCALANATLKRSGFQPTFYIEGTMMLGDRSGENRRNERVAGLIAMFEVCGPEFTVNCEDHDSPGLNVACKRITVRDALMGRTCGAS